MEDLESPEIRQEVVGQDENKENEIIQGNANIQIQKNQTKSVNRESGVSLREIQTGADPK